MKVDPQDISAVAAVASAIAAVAATFVASFSWKVQKNLLHSEVMPELRPSYEFGNDHIILENLGKGTAVKIKLQRSQHHIIDRKKIVAYSLSSQSRKTIRPGEKQKIYIEPNKRIDSPKEDAHLKDFDLFRYIESIGKNKQLGLVYQDIFGQKILLRVQFKEDSRNYYIESYGIKRCSFLFEPLDWLSALRFRILKIPREILWAAKGKLNTLPNFLKGLVSKAVKMVR